MKKNLWILFGLILLTAGILIFPQGRLKVRNTTKFTAYLNGESKPGEETYVVDSEELSEELKDFVQSLKVKKTADTKTAFEITMKFENGTNVHMSYNMTLIRISKEEGKFYQDYTILNEDKEAAAEELRTIVEKIKEQGTLIEE